MSLYAMCMYSMHIMELLKSASGQSVRTTIGCLSRLFLNWWTSSDTRASDCAERGRRVKLSRTQRAVLEVLAQPAMHMYGVGGFYYPKGIPDRYGKRFPAQSLIVLKRRGLIEFRKHSIINTRAFITPAGRVALSGHTEGE